MIVNCRTFVIANISNIKLSVIYILKNFEQVEHNMRLIFLTHLVRHSVLEKLRMRTLKKEYHWTWFQRAVLDDVHWILDFGPLIVSEFFFPLLDIFRFLEYEDFSLAVFRMGQF